MERRLKLGVDMDGVIVDFTSAFKEEAETVLHRQMPKIKPTWAFSNWGITKEERERVWNRIVNTDDWFYYNCNAYPGVSQLLPWLTEQHEVFFITTRAETGGMSVQRQTQMHLADLGVQFPSVIVTSNKGAVAAALQLDAFVDDKTSNVQSVVDQSPTTKVFQVESYEGQKGPWPQLESFKEFCEKIDELAKRPQGA